MRFKLWFQLMLALTYTLTSTFFAEAELHESGDARMAEFIAPAPRPRYSHDIVSRSLRKHERPGAMPAPAIRKFLEPWFHG